VVHDDLPRETHYLVDCESLVTSHRSSRYKGYRGSGGGCPNKEGLEGANHETERKSIQAGGTADAKAGDRPLAGMFQSRKGRLWAGTWRDGEMKVRLPG
jgi:hypothetical protein